MEPAEALEGVAIIVVAVVVLVLINAVWEYNRRAWRQALSQLSASYPMTIDNTGSMGGTGTGDTPDGKLVIDAFGERAGGSSGSYTRVRLSAPFLLSLSICDDGVVALSKWAGAVEVETGDFEFDDAVRLHGSPSEIRARLTRAARQLLLPEVLAGLRIKEGTIDLRRPGIVYDAHELVRMVRTVLDIARSMRIGDVATALYENASHDPVAGVRLACAQELVQMRAATPERMRTWLGHADLRLKLIAAQALGDEGFDALVELANPETHVGQEALRVLASRFRDRAAATLRRHEEALRGAIADIAARLERDGMRAGPTPNKMKAQIDLLGAIGTIDSVETLLMPHLPPDAARKAIREIQGRVPGAEGGRLTVADSQGGELSDATDEGRVSLADPTRTLATR